MTMFRLAHLRHAARRTARAAAWSARRRTMASGPAPINEPGGWFLGRAPGAPRAAREGWERQTYWCLYGGSAFLVACLCSAPNTSIKAWGRDEAEARNNPRDPEQAVSPGEHVEPRGSPWAKAAPGAVPTYGS